MNEYNFSDKYVGLNTPLNQDLPKELFVEGEILLLKDEFHMSIHCIIETKHNHGISHEEIIKHFNDYIENQKITFTGFGSDLRLCKEREKMSIVVMVDSNNLSEYFDDFNKSFGVVVPTQPAHITLYTLQKNKGIDLTSPEAIQEKTNLIKEEELEKILFTKKE